MLIENYYIRIRILIFNLVFFRNLEKVHLRGTKYCTTFEFQTKFASMSHGYELFYNINYIIINR